MIPKRPKKRIRVYYDPTPLPFRQRARAFLYANRRPLIAILIIMSWLMCAGVVFVVKTG